EQYDQRLHAAKQCVAVGVLLVIDHHAWPHEAESFALRIEAQVRAGVHLAIADLRHEAEVRTEVVAEVAPFDEPVILSLDVVPAEGQGVRGAARSAVEL